MTDQQLLRDYAEHQSDSAFAELVQRHVDLVYSAALRMVCDGHLAEDVTQGVFVALARNAPQLTECCVLSAWLHRTARNLAANTVRSEVRRRAREQEAVAMNGLFSPEPNAAWDQIAPHLDTALGELTEADRDALLLRYFQRKSAREIAGILGTSEDAAQRRVSRAVERLRDVFAKRGVAVGASGLMLALSANAVQAAPVGLATTICAAAALAETTLITAATATVTKTLAMTSVQKVVVLGALVAAIGAGLFEARRASTLRTEVEALHESQAYLSDQLQQLERERDDAKNRLAALVEEISSTKGNNQELLRLRGEVTRLRADAGQAKTPFVQTALTWKTKEEQLRRLFVERPGQSIPELQLLDDESWLDAAKNADLDSDDGRRSAMSGLRQTAENHFVVRFHAALRSYLEANQGQFPANVALLQPFFEPPVEGAFLQRYELRPAKEFPTQRLGGDWYITQKVAVDADYDQRWVIGQNGFGPTSFKTASSQ